MTEPPAPLLEGPPAEVGDPRELLLGYLDWYREALLRKIAGLSDARLRALPGPLQWSPLGLVKHLGWVERRWIQWGFAAEDVAPYPPAGPDSDMTVAADEPADGVVGDYLAQVAISRATIGDAPLDAPSRLGGRFGPGQPAPPLGRILFHLLQEYARHLGHLDVARELIDGTTGE